MDTSRKICTVLTAQDLSAEKISETAATIEHNLGKVYLLSSDSRLYKVIDRLSKVFHKKSKLTKTHIAYNLEFALKTILKTGNNLSTEGFAVKSLADLLELVLDENLSLKREDYHVIIDDENSVDKNLANQAVARLFQQTIFLNIGLDIQKKSEIKMAIMKDRFRENYSALRSQIAEQKNLLTTAVNRAPLNESGLRRVKEILAALEKTDIRLDEAKKRPLRIAAMGTKKAGKSVVINDLLRRDFAPTSSELPTPNTVKYIPIAPDGQLTLDYAGKKFTFVTAEDLKKFIDDEFTKAQEQTGKGAALPDMTIYYPCDDLNGYEIWDTPGPNYAGAGDEHRKNAEACIREVDVCIFVMDYSKYLTDDEAKFLKNIRSAFQKNDKFYSLFITVNKIDLIYTAEVQKSVNRVLDYISDKLEELDYKNIVVFGTSALQSFYLDKVIELAKADGATKPPFVTTDSVNKLAKNHMDEDDLLMTQIDTIGGMINKLLRFHGIKDATEKEIEAFSGIPQLRRYTKYIGDTKADMEIVNKVVGDCEGQFTIIKSALDVLEYQTLSDEAKKYLATVVPKIDEVHKMSREIKERLKYLLDLRALREAKEEAQKFFDSTKSQAVRDFDANIVFFCRNITEQDIRDFVESNGKNRGFINVILANVAANFEYIVNSGGEETTRTARVIAGNRKSKIERGLNEETNRIVAKVKSINELLKKSGVPTITLPSFPVSVSINVSDVKFKGDGIDFDKFFNFAASSIKEVEREGFFGWIADIFTTKTVVDIEEFKRNISAEIKRIGHPELEREFNNLSRQLKDELEKVFNRFDKDCDETQKIYTTIFENTNRNIIEVRDATGKKKEELDRNIESLNYIAKKMQPFFTIWKHIRVEDTTQDALEARDTTKDKNVEPPETVRDEIGKKKEELVEKAKTFTENIQPLRKIWSIFRREDK